MTAPMVIASRINLQYYGLSVNNRAFGSGNKALHHGTRFTHEPMRLNVFIAAPVAAMNEVLVASQALG